MSRYRKVDPRIWNDQKFRRLNDRGKMAFFFLLTHPHMTAIGAMRATVEGLAAELGWSTDAMRDAINDAIKLGMVVANSDASFVCLPNFIKYNKPEGPNSVIKAWPAALELLPECPEKRELALRCKNFLENIGPNFFAKTDTSKLFDAIEDAIMEGIKDGMQDAIGDGIIDAMSEPSRIQEQEQEQEQEIVRGDPPAHAIRDGIGDGILDGKQPPEPSPSAPAPQKKSRSEKKTRIKPKPIGQQAMLEGTEWHPPEGDNEIRDMVLGYQTERGTRLPADYVVSENWLMKARKARPELPEEQIASAAESFVSYWSSKPGKDGLKLNWFSAWMNWVRRERPWPAGGHSRTDSPRMLPPSNSTGEKDPERERKMREFLSKYPGAQVHDY